MTTILIAEDEARIASFLDKGLRANGYRTEIAPDGERALQRARSGEFDLLLLDLGLPGMDGIDVIRRLRDEQSELPVVILTARDSVEDTVAGLDLGADDYVTKPFRFDELLARVKARLRVAESLEPMTLQAGDAALDLRRHRAIVEGRAINLSAREFELAVFLFRHAGQVLTREQLLAEVWKADLTSGSNVVDVYVGYLRRKLGRKRITSVRGLGYRLETRASRTAPAPSAKRRR